MLVWGGIGTRMDADVEELLIKWCARFKGREWRVIPIAYAVYSAIMWFKGWSSELKRIMFGWRHQPKLLPWSISSEKYNDFPGKCLYFAVDIKMPINSISGLMRPKGRKRYCSFGMIVRFNGKTRNIIICHLSCKSLIVTWCSSTELSRRNIDYLVICGLLIPAKYFLFKIL